jgi:hypothetical protein
MPDIRWTCENCGEHNPPYTEACRSCGQMSPVNGILNELCSTPISAANPRAGPKLLESACLVILWGVGAFISFFIATLSINATIMTIFLLTNLTCLGLAIGLLSKNKIIPAFIAALSSVPASFGFVLMFFV